MVGADFNFLKPDYLPIFKERERRLIYLRNNPNKIKSLKQYYRQNIAQFITDWGTSFDPRNVQKGIPNTVPFILMPKQIEWVSWLLEHWQNEKPGIVEKTRTVGMSWLSMAVACSICILYDDISIGFGSRKQDYVDKKGDLDSLLEKGRLFVSLLPIEFRGGFQRDKTDKLMLLEFPESGSSIKGETGDGIGRGGRNSLYFVDESAFLERPYLVDASLSENTNCRIDISTPNGLANSFAERRHSGKIDVFTFHWRDDLRRDEAWYAKKVIEIDNPVIVAQELDINYSASVEGVVIPSEWVQAAVDAHIKLGIQPSGVRKCAWDVADSGTDKNAVCGRHGILVEYIEEWSGINGDILESTYKVFQICDELGYREFDYDADGLGASVRGDARTANEHRINGTEIAISPFHGSGTIINPNEKISENKTNADFFVNLKAQSWWTLRNLFKNTYRAVVEGIEVDQDSIISISSKVKHLTKLLGELSQPTFSTNSAGKILIDKRPNGLKSPNLADSIMMVFAPSVAIVNWNDPQFQQEIQNMHDMNVYNEWDTL